MAHYTTPSGPHPNRSQAIGSYNGQHPDMMPTDADRGDIPPGMGSGKQNVANRYPQQPQDYHGRQDDRSGSQKSWSGWVKSRFHPDVTYEDRHEDEQDRYRRERNEARSKVKVLEDDITQLKRDLSRQHDAVLETKESATRVRLAMQDKELFIGPQALDRVVQEQFLTLFKNVRSWSRFLIGGASVDLSTIKPEVQKQFHAIAPGTTGATLGTMLSNKSTRRYFMQGWIALVMVEKLFPTLPDRHHLGTKTRDLWLEKDQAKDFFYLEEELFTQAVSPRDFNDWRAYTASLLKKSRGSEGLPASTTEYLMEICRDVMETAGKWCTEPSEQQNMASELLSIFSDAIQFVQLLRTQRAQWSLRFPKPPPPPSHEGNTYYAGGNPQEPFIMFDPFTMRSITPHDDDEVTHNKHVKIFITPALFKRGDEDGDKFDVFSCIDQSVIMWSEIPNQYASALPHQHQQQQQPPPPPFKRPNLPTRSLTGIAGPTQSRGLVEDSNPANTHPDGANGSGMESYNGSRDVQMQDFGQVGPGGVLPNQKPVAASFQGSEGGPPQQPMK